MDKTSAAVEKRCSLCNKVCFPRSTPTEEVPSDASIYNAFSQLGGMDVSQFGNVFPDGVENVKLCEDCKSKLTNSLDATGKVVMELKSLENKVDLAISQLQTISDIPSREGGALFFQRGVNNATSKLETLKYILKTTQLGTTGPLEGFPSQFPLPTGAGPSSNSKNDYDPSSVPGFQEKENAACANGNANNRVGATNETDDRDDGWLTIESVFQVKTEPRGEEDNPEMEDQEADQNSFSTDAETIPEALVKIEPPEFKELRGKTIYRASKNLPLIINNPSESLLPRVDTSASSGVPSTAMPELIDLVPKPKTSKRKLPEGAASSSAKKGTVGDTASSSQASDTKENDEEGIIKQLCQAVKDIDLDKIKEQVLREDVRKVIKKTFSEEKERSMELDNVARLIITCAESTLYDDDKQLEEKKKLISFLIDVNYKFALAGSRSIVKKSELEKHEQSQRYYSALLSLDVHPDLILFLLDLKAKWDYESNLHIHLYTSSPRRIIEIYVKSFEKVFSKLPEGGFVNSLGSYLENGLISQEQFKLITEASRSLNRELDPEGNTILSLIVKTKKGVQGKSMIETIKTLKQWGASFDWRGRMTGESLLHLAVESGEVEVVENFLKEKPNLTVVLDKRGFSPLDSVVHEIMKYNDTDILERMGRSLTIAKKLLQGGGNFARLGQPEKERNLFHLLALPDKYIDQVGFKTELLFRLGLNVNQVDKFGNSPLHIACESVAEKCRAVEFKDPDPANVLTFELINHFDDIVSRKIVYSKFRSCHRREVADALCTIRALVRCGANITEKNRLGETPVNIIDRLETGRYIANAAMRCLK